MKPNSFVPESEQVTPLTFPQTTCHQRVRYLSPIDQMYPPRIHRPLSDFTLVCLVRRIFLDVSVHICLKILQNQFIPSKVLSYFATVVQHLPLIYPTHNVQSFRFLSCTQCLLDPVSVIVHIAPVRLSTPSLPADIPYEICRFILSPFLETLSRRVFHPSIFVSNSLYFDC